MTRIKQDLQFSVVTATQNRLNMLREAVESVRVQRWPSVEHIIVDGGSSDGTEAWVRSQGDLRWIAGPDRGPYDAFNKGIAAATGDVVVFLNSDDTFATGTFDAVAAAFESDPRVDVVAGGSVLTENGAVVEDFTSKKDIDPDPRNVLLDRCLPNPRFFKRSALAKVGGFSDDYALIADRDFILRVVEAGCYTKVLNRCVYYYRRHEGSLTFDAGRSRTLHLRKELIQLGIYWRNNPHASAEARSAARILEGRQRFMLALATVGSSPIAGFRLLVMGKSGPAFSPITAIAWAGWDFSLRWIAQQFCSKPAR